MQNKTTESYFSNKIILKRHKESAKKSTFVLGNKHLRPNKGNKTATERNVGGRLMQKANCEMRGSLNLTIMF